MSPEVTGRSCEAFTSVRSLYPDVPASLCNSYGTFLPAEIGYDLLRPGVALYGSNPLPGQPNPMESVITLSAQVLQVRSVLPGDKPAVRKNFFYPANLRYRGNWLCAYQA